MAQENIKSLSYPLGVNNYALSQRTVNNIIQESIDALSQAKNKSNVTRSSSLQEAIQEPTIAVTVGGHTIRGYLAEEGFQLILSNKYDKLFGDGNIFSTTAKGIQQAKILFGDINADLPGKAMALAKGESVSFATSKDSIIAGVVTNSPMFWTGTEPLKLNLKFFQIAESEGEIKESYYKMLYNGSPDLYNSQAIISTVTYELNISVEVYGLYFTNILLRSLTCNIKGPFDKAGSPVVGEYDMSLESAKMVDKARIKEVFQKI